MPVNRTSSFYPPPGEHVSIPEHDHYYPLPKQSRSQDHALTSADGVSEDSERSFRPNLRPDVVSYTYHSQDQPQPQSEPHADSTLSQEMDRMFGNRSFECGSYDRGPSAMRERASEDLGPENLGSRSKVNSQNSASNLLSKPLRPNAVHTQPTSSSSEGAPDPQHVSRMHTVNPKLLEDRSITSSYRSSHKRKRAYRGWCVRAGLFLAILLSIVALVLSIIALAKSKRPSRPISSSASSLSTTHAHFNDTPTKPESAQSGMTAESHLITQSVDITVPPTLTHQSTITRNDFTITFIPSSPTPNIIFSTNTVKSTFVETVDMASDQPQQTAHAMELEKVMKQEGDYERQRYSSKRQTTGSTRTNLVNGRWETELFDHGDIETGDEDQRRQYKNTTSTNSQAMYIHRPRSELTPPSSSSASYGIPVANSASRSNRVHPFFNTLQSFFGGPVFSPIRKTYRAYIKFIAAHANAFACYNTTTAIVVTLCLIALFVALINLYAKASPYIRLLKNVKEEMMKQLKEMLAKGDDFFKSILEQVSKHFSDKFDNFKSELKDNMQNELKKQLEEFKSKLKDLPKVPDVKLPDVKIPRDGLDSIDALVSVAMTTAATPIVPSSISTMSTLLQKSTALNQRCTTSATNPSLSASTLSTSPLPSSTTIPYPFPALPMKSNTARRRQVPKLLNPLCCLVIIAAALLFVGASAADDRKTSTLAISKIPENTPSISPALIARSLYPQPLSFSSRKREPGILGEDAKQPRKHLPPNQEDKNSATQTEDHHANSIVAAPESIITSISTSTSSSSTSNGAKTASPSMSLQSAAARNLRVPFPFALLAHSKIVSAGFYSHNRRDEDSNNASIDREQKQKAQHKNHTSKGNPESRKKKSCKNCH